MRACLHVLVKRGSSVHTEKMSVSLVERALPSIHILQTIHTQGPGGATLQPSRSSQSSALPTPSSALVQSSASSSKSRTLHRALRRRLHSASA